MEYLDYFIKSHSRIGGILKRSAKTRFLAGFFAYAVIVAVTLGVSVGGRYHGNGTKENGQDTFSSASPPGGSETVADTTTAASPAPGESEPDLLASASPISGFSESGTATDMNAGASPAARRGTNAAPDMVTGPSPAPGTGSTPPPDLETGPSPAPAPGTGSTPPPDLETGPSPAPPPNPAPTPSPDTETGPSPAPGTGKTKPPAPKPEDDEKEEDDVPKPKPPKEGKSKTSALLYLAPLLGIFAMNFVGLGAGGRRHSRKDEVER